MKLRSIEIKDSQDLIKTLMTESWSGGAFEFVAEPDIIENKFIELYDLLDELKKYYTAYELLKKHEEMIRSCDNELLDSFKNIIDQMVEIIFVSMKSKHEFYFSSTEISSSILSKLNKGIINVEAIRMLEGALANKCDQNLVSVQQKLFEMSSS